MGSPPFVKSGSKKLPPVKEGRPHSQQHRTAFAVRFYNSTLTDKLQPLLRCPNGHKKKTAPVVRQGRPLQKIHHVNRDVLRPYRSTSGKECQMAKRINYAAMFTLRKDGRYVASHTDGTGRHYIYHRDPEQLYKKLQALSDPDQDRKSVV